MHANELNVHLDLVRDLINEQFPEYSMLPLSPSSVVGTVNNIYRLGDELCVRLPRVIEWADIDKEFEWLPRLAPHITLEIPEPIALGQPNVSYPAKWAIYRWIDGSEYRDQSIHDEGEAARHLAGYVNEMRSIAVSPEAPRGGRPPLLDLHKKTLDAIETAKDVQDVDRVLAAWEDARQASVWNGHAVWIHADLLRTNLLVLSGRISAVVDFGSAGVGDPAFDLIPAWSVFGSRGRRLFRALVESDRDTWLRARGYALHQALLIIPYYRETYPAFASHARNTISQVLLDVESESKARAGCNA